MKKTIYFVSITTLLLIALASCGGDSYQKRLDKEKKAIKKALENIEELATYPSNHKFGEYQYYQEGSTGIYYQVVDQGNLDEVPKEIGKRQRMFIRFDSVHYMVSDVWVQGNRRDQSAVPLEFEYLNTTTYTASAASSQFVQYFMSPSLVLPLEKGLGNGAVVNIIVPFTQGSAIQQQSSYEPYHFKGLIYTFRKEAENTEEETTDK